jgi:cell fate (sporulation/competence/biofilm development) regulator YlbF (YheA/YmcA/DUF963 family)
MFKSTTTAFLIAASFTSALASSAVPLEARGGIGKAATHIGADAANGAASSLTTWALNKIKREDIEARGKIGKAATEVGGQAANGAAGAFTTWALNKIRDDVDARDLIEDLFEAREDLEARGKFGKAATEVGGQAANGAAGALTSWALNKLRDDVEAREPMVRPFTACGGLNCGGLGLARPPTFPREDIDARSSIGKAATHIGGDAANGVASSLTTWALNKLRKDVEAREDFEEFFEAREELEARGKFGKAATDVGGQAANGVASSLTTWALNKIRSEELEARGSIGKVATHIGGDAANGAAGALTSWALGKLRREDLLEARDIIDEFLEARDYEFDDLE